MKDISSDLILRKEYEKLTTSVLAAEILGYLDAGNRHVKLPSHIQLAASTLTQRLMQNVPFNGIQSWTDFKILQKMMSGKELTDLESSQLKSWLYQKVDRQIRNKQGYLSAEKLEQAFWKQLK